MSNIFKSNYLKNYFYIFILAYITLFITKVIFYFYLYDNFQEVSILDAVKSVLWGYKFDFATASIIGFLATLVDFHKKSLVLFASFLLSLLILIQISDIMYFYESTRHIGYEVSDVINDAFGLGMTAFSQHTFLTITTILVSIAIFFYFIQNFQQKLYKIEINKIYLLKKLFLIILTVFFIRGMFQGIPLNPWQSNQIGDTKKATLALNGTYNAIYALTNKSKKLKPMRLPILDETITKETLKKLYKSKYTPYTTTLKQPNIVIFFLESWSAVNIKSYGFNKSDIAPTPFYDKMLLHSIRPKAMIAGGHRTTEGLFASLCSYQNPLGKTVAKTQLQDFHYTSLIDILNNNGYQSAFFQGTSKETSGTGSFAQTLGFTDSYGKKDVQKRFYEENYWGVHDFDLYNFALEKLAPIKKPFVIGINGATTHDDKIPKTIKKIHFVENESLNNQLNALHFADMALQKFVNNIQIKYPNTLFVFMADHCGGVKGSSFENYMIPFALYHKDLKAKYMDYYISQKDLAPTVLDAVLGHYKSYTNNFSGKSLFSDSEFFGDYYHNGILGWVEKNKAVELNMATNTIRCLDISTFKDKNIQCTKELNNFKTKALSFTNISQKLLFDGKVDNFNEYKYAK